MWVAMGCIFLGAIFGVIFAPIPGGIVAAILWQIFWLIFSPNTSEDILSDE